MDSRLIPYQITDLIEFLSNKFDRGPYGAKLDTSKIVLALCALSGKAPGGVVFSFISTHHHHQKSSRL